MDVLCWMGLRARASNPVRRAVPPPTAASAADARDEDVPRGCGWFDSSLDLRLGLAVRELDDVAELLRGLRGVAPAAAPR